MVATALLLVVSTVSATPDAAKAPKDAKAAKAGKDAKTPKDAKAGKDAGKDAAKDAKDGKDAKAGEPATPPPADAAPTPAPAVDLASVKPEDMPVAVRLRRLEQKVQALKERAWQIKARVGLLKEQTLGGGVGAQALIAHANNMGSSFRLTKLLYSLDGTQIFVRTDESAENLYKSKSFDIFAGPISPGSHVVGAVAVYRGHGYGVFEYLSKYTFQVKGNQTFTAVEGKVTKVDGNGFEKGGPTTPLEKRPAIEFKVTQVQPEKAADAPAMTPAPATTPATMPAPAAGK
jgi:hypothetical protein